ncbi:divalent-cation tolerance protein CutA [Arthrobacter sp. NEB 688]|nr:divalent-cation tolerance protein CutA [Arthrobacter sp. NEB 688]
MPGLVETLLDERLIACGHLTPIESTYRWQGAIEHASEVRAAMHTTKGRVEALRQRVRGLHTYDVPCILVLPVPRGDCDYLNWVDEETRPAPTRP